jgi:hypothetical protein
MPQEEVKQLREELRNAEGEEERLSIYKDYGLIPQHVTLDKLRAGMEEKAQRLGITREKLEEIQKQIFKNIRNNDIISIVLRFLCYVEGDAGWGLRLYLPMSFFTARINSLFVLLGLPIAIPSIDLMNIGLVFLGGIYTSGIIRPPKDQNYFGIMFYLVLGFVGFAFAINPLFIFGAELFIGFSALTFAVGTPDPLES